jgi:leader peptidase (prepilin peptidase) / N-methyltransferase
MFFLFLALVFVFLIFVLGAAWCGFFQCMIYRKNKGIDLRIRRSFCDDCGKTLLWIDTVPFINYLVLRGKCRYCGMRLPYRYFIAETISGLVALSCIVVPLSWLWLVPSVMAVIFMIAYSFYYYL